MVVVEMTMVVEVEVILLHLLLFVRYNECIS
jgi:hypothetical protein